MRGAILALVGGLSGRWFVYPYTVPKPGFLRQSAALPSAALILALGLGACFLYLSVELHLLSGELGFPLDDSWIHLQFARNLAAGNGLSFNPGELVPGSTAPLWTALLSTVFLLPGSELVWTKVAGVLLYLVGGFLTRRLALELGLAPRLATLAAVLTMATSWLVWSALSGLEIALFVVLTLAGILLHVRERRDPWRAPLSLPILAVGFLVRPEAVLLVGAAVLDRFLVWRSDQDGGLRWRAPRWREILFGLTIFAVVAGPVCLFNLSLTGSILPTTFGAKSGGLMRWIPEIGYLYTVFGIFFRVQPWMTLLAGAGALTLLARLGSEDDAGLLPVLWILGLPCAYALLDPPGLTLVGNFGRYFFPLFPVVVILGVLAIEPLVQRADDGLGKGPVQAFLRLAALLILLLPTFSSLGREAKLYGRNVVNVQDSDVRVARWLSGRLSPDAVLGVGDIGAIKYLLPNRVVDLAGIANPEIKIWGAERFLDHHRPDYLVIFPSWLQRLVGDSPSFRAVREFAITDNITMGGDTLVVYSTPWTRFPLAEATGPPAGD